MPAAVDGVHRHQPRLQSSVLMAVGGGCFVCFIFRGEPAGGATVAAWVCARACMSVWANAGGETMPRGSPSFPLQLSRCDLSELLILEMHTEDSANKPDTHT